MASELQWVHQYCLTCDQQTDGATYCSESCRLADYEEATQFSPPASGPGSPSWAPTGISTYPWSMGAPSARSRQLFTLTPNYDFHPHQTAQSAQSSKPAQPTSSLSLPPTSSSTATTTVTYHHVLSPSSSQTSLSSMRSSTSSTSGALGALSAFANGSASQSSFSSSSTAAAAAAAAAGASTASGANDLSQRVRSELRKYASSLEQGRLQRQLQRRTSC